MGAGRPGPCLRCLGIWSREVYHARPIRRGEKRGPCWFQRSGDTLLSIVYQTNDMSLTCGEGAEASADTDTCSGTYSGTSTCLVRLVAVELAAAVAAAVVDV